MLQKILDYKNACHIYEKYTEEKKKKISDKNSVMFNSYPLGWMILYFVCFVMNDVITKLERINLNAIELKKIEKSWEIVFFSYDV